MRFVVCAFAFRAFDAATRILLRMNLRLSSLRGLSVRDLVLDGDVGPPEACEGHTEAQKRSQLTRTRKSSILIIPQEIPNYEQLRQLNAKTLVDSFFALYVRTGPQWTLVHVSEVIYGNLSPQFRQLSLPRLPRDCSQFQIKVWARHQNGPWHLLVHLRASTTSIHEIETEAETKNFVELDFDGKLYYIDKKTQSEKKTPNSTPAQKKSYAFEAVRSLTKLERSVAELESSKQLFSHNIDDSIHWLIDPENINTMPYKTEKLKRQIRQLDEYIRRQRSNNDCILHEIMHYKVAIDDIKRLVDDRFPEIVATTTHQIEMLDQECYPLQEALQEQLYPEIRKKVFEHASLVLQFVPIENAEGSVRFSVVGIEFPPTIHELLDTCYDPSPESQAKLVEINAGLGYILQMVQALAEVLGVQLGFKMEPQGCESFIFDTFGHSYTLHYDIRRTKNQQNENFERGLHLLNQNLQQLIHATGIQLKHLNPQAAFNPIPHDSWDNLLWRLQWLVLMVTAKHN